MYLLPTSQRLHFSSSQLTVPQNLFLGMITLSLSKRVTELANPGFTGIVTASALWSMWGGDMFPADKDPTGDPETWTLSELRRWLEAVCVLRIAD